MGLPIAPHAAIGEVTDTDVIIVADLALNPDLDPHGAWPEMADWVRRQHDAGAIVCSVCTGTVLLASTGLLNGHEATTHWSACGIIEKYFPEVTMRPERIIVPAGHEHRIVTGGGSSSWEDLSLYLITRLCGNTEARQTAKIFLLGDRSDGQLPFAVMGKPKSHDDATISACQTWAALHYDDDNPVARMVAQSGLAERTFKRRFKAATGYAPIDYVQTLRIEEAKQMLETTAEPTDRIALQVGYEDPTFFRRLFKRRTGVTPARYRQKFKSLVRL
jgi:transcriptional regulator GlxA family with amidase domain